VLILSHRSVTRGRELHRSAKALEVVEPKPEKKQLHVCLTASCLVPIWSLNATVLETLIYGLFDYLRDSL